MHRSRIRNKTYKPRQVKVPCILDNPLVPPEILERLNSEMNNRVLRLKLSGGCGLDLATLVVCFGQAWILADLMDQGTELRKQLEDGVQALSRDILRGRAELQDATFDILLDMAEITSAIVAASTQKEYLLACDRLKVEGAVPFVDDFLEVLAKADLLEIIDFPGSKGISADQRNQDQSQH